MTQRLFVYGTLVPGQPNEHILKDIGGSWEAATVKGTLHNKGWGADMGYPGIDLSEDGDAIEGYIFTSNNLSDHWDSLDAFEGEAYRRVLAQVTSKDGTTFNAFIYTLASPNSN